MPGQFNPLQMLAQPQKPKLPPYQNDSLDLYGLAGEFGDEAELRSIMAQKAGGAPNEVGALDRLSGSWRNKQAGAMENMMPTPAMNETTSAINEGFGSNEMAGLDRNPVIARNLYKRKMEQEKLRQPIEQERMKEAGATQRQEMASGATRYTADQNRASDLETETVRQGPQNSYAETQRMLLIDQNGSPRGGPIKSVGKGTTSFQNQPNQQSMLNQGTIVQGNMANQGNAMVVNESNPSREQAEYNAWVKNMVSQSGIPPEGQIEVMNILRDPQNVNRSLEELFNSPNDESVPVEQRATPQEWAALVKLLTAIRGF